MGELLILAPWWVSVGLAPIVYGVLTKVLPGIDVTNPLFKMLIPVGVKLAPFAAAFLLLFGFLSWFRRWKIGYQFSQQKSVATLTDLPWKDFEDLTGELFRRRGYAIEESLNRGADGGVDLRLHQGGSTTLVQCKRWKSVKVGLPVVRELLGAITAEKAARGILVTTSSFTEEARAFARSNGIELIDGEQLTRAVRALQSGGAKAASPLLPERAIPSPPTDQRTCPKCGNDMVKRTARKGANAGNDFWGCRGFPQCRYTEGGVK